jgi:hypothetical protein
MSAAAEQPRPTPTQAFRELAMAHATRTPRGQELACEVGQEARTKEWYVKSIQVSMMDGEGWEPFAVRVGWIATAIAAALPVTNGGTE